MTDKFLRCSVPFSMAGTTGYVREVIHVLQAREKVDEAVRLGFQDDPEFIHRSLSTLNAEAVRHCKAGDHIAAVAAFCKLFERARVKNLIHPEMHVCYRLVDML